MKNLFILFTLMASMAVCGQQTIADPNAQVRKVENFHAIHVGSAFDVFLTQGSEEKVVVSAAEQKDLQYIIVEVKNGVLNVGWDHKSMRWLKGNKKLKAYISFKLIDELEASGACDVNIEGILKADKDLRIDLSGASDLKGKIEVAQKLSVDLSGASDAKVSGRAADLWIDASGASSFKGFEFAVDYCGVKASGASDIKITVNKELTANATGASDVGYRGSCVVRDVRTSGASSVSRS